MSASMPSSFDVLKPSNLIIALIACVLLILLGWYLFVLKPALHESNPIDLKVTKEPFSHTPFSPELKFKSGVETHFTNAEIEQPKTAFENERVPEATPLNTPQRVNASHRPSIKKAVVTRQAINKKAHASHRADCPCLREEQQAKAENEEAFDNKHRIKTAALVFKESFLTPATKPSCSQVQIAMNQCPN
jgi:hypothetical protein